MKSTKLIVAYPQPKDVKAFEAVYQNEHVPLALANLAGKTKMVSTKTVQTPQGMPAFYRIAEVHFPVLTQVWCKRNGLENSRGEQTSAEQFEAGAAIHLPLEGFQPVDVTFHRTVAERLL